MRALKYWASNMRDGLKNQSARLAKSFGVNLLTKDQTIAYLSDYQIAAHAGSIVMLPEVLNMTDRTTVLFNRSEIMTTQTKVWHYERTSAKATLFSSGGIKIDQNVLDTDYGTSAVFKEIFKPERRAAYDVDVLIAPWSHSWSGYYDYLIYVVAKLCRMKAALPNNVFDEALIAYPLLHTSFERELLTLIGVPLENVVDSRNSAVKFRSCVIGNSSNWFFPNPADVLLLRKQIYSNMSVQNTSGERIYIRRSGRRRILNEDALINLLSKYKVEVVDDKPRTVAEQFAIYNNASFIIGPHGASLANLLWCKPGSYLVELFADNYAQQHYRYLAQLVGVNYFAYCYGRFNEPHFSNVDLDIFVSIEQIERSLDELFEHQITA